MIIDEPMREHRSTRRTFRFVEWMLATCVGVGVAEVVTAFLLQRAGVEVSWLVWSRSVVVLGLTSSLFFFVGRARSGRYWAYQRLRLFSRVFPVVTLLVAFIPGLYPSAITAEQVVFSVLLLVVGQALSTEHMRDTFPTPTRP